MGKTEVECCDVTCIHNENVKLALEQMPDEELLNSLADFYKAFADGTRGYGAYYRIKRYISWEMTDQSVFLHLGEAKMQVSK